MVVRHNPYQPNEFDAAFIAHARTDIPELISEVKRLQKALTAVIKGYPNEAFENAALTYEVEQLKTEKATLKKALELMAKYIVEFGRVDYFLCDNIPQLLHLQYQPKNDGNYENKPCIKCVQEYFIQQAQEQEEKK